MSRLVEIGPNIRLCCKKGCKNAATIELVVYTVDGSDPLLPFCRTHINTASELLDSLNLSMLEQELGAPFKDKGVPPSHQLPPHDPTDPTSGEGSPL